MQALRQLMGMSAWMRIFLIIFVIQTGILLYVFAPKLSSSNAAVSGDFTDPRLSETIQYLKGLKRQNSEIKQLIDEFLSQNNKNSSASKLIERQHDQSNENTLASNDMIPSTEYETLRRRVRANTLEMYNFVNAELNEIAAKSSELGQHVRKVASKVTEHKHSLINDIDLMRTVDGYEDWRHTEEERLSDLVQRRLEYLQNPSDCSKARKIVCSMNKGCGFGCQLHHVAFCLLMSYATERTLIIDSNDWNYYKGSWEDLFKPISNTCTTSNGSTHADWGKDHNNAQVVHLPMHESVIPKPPQYPLAIPDDLAPRLTRLHGQPIVWWISQLMKYFWRFQPKTQSFVDAGIERLGFKKPIVGVHIRRTDKIRNNDEAERHEIEEYMKWVDEYYQQLEMMNVTVHKRRIYLAADDAQVIEEARKKYPNYEIIANRNAAEKAGPAVRYSNSSLFGVILDIHLLSLSDYLVCTFSSTICRAAYTIMQGTKANLTNLNGNSEPMDRYKSLDDIYSFAGQDLHTFEAVVQHNPENQNEMSMSVGDEIGVPECWLYHCRRYKNGYLEGRNLRTNQTGVFPSFKVVDVVKTAEFPKYANVKL